MVFDCLPLLWFCCVYVARAIIFPLSLISILLPSLCVCKHFLQSSCCGYTFLFLNTINLARMKPIRNLIR